jgi:hypothetical protein
MTSPYLDQPLLPLAVALPRMVRQIETQPAGETAEADERGRLRQRAELIRRLLTTILQSPQSVSVDPDALDLLKE